MQNGDFCKREKQTKEVSWEVGDMGSKMLLYVVLFHRPSLTDVFEGDPAAGKEPVEGSEKSVGHCRRKSSPRGRP